MRRIGLTSKIPTLVVALVFLIPCVSWADLITPTQEQDIAATPTDWGPSSGTHPVAPLQFSLFDPSLGTLTGVNISLDYNFASSVTLTACDQNRSRLVSGDRPIR